MPYADLNGARIHYTDTGGDGEAVAFSHRLDPQQTIPPLG